MQRRKLPPKSRKELNRPLSVLICGLLSPPHFSPARLRRRAPRAPLRARWSPSSRRAEIAPRSTTHPAADMPWRKSLPYQRPPSVHKQQSCCEGPQFLCCPLCSVIDRLSFLLPSSNSASSSHPPARSLLPQETQTQPHGRSTSEDERLTPTGRRVLEFLRVFFGEDNDELSMELMLRREDDSLVAAKPAAQFFAQCLQLHNSKYIQIQQERHFADISVRKGPKWEPALV